MQGLVRTLCAILAAMLLAPRSAKAVVIGQIDTFQDGTTMGWFVPGASPSPPGNVPNGGPGGVGDAYLSLVALGGGAPGGRLSVLNSSQWAGDYLSSGVMFIRMDVNNFGPEDLFLRLLVEDFDGPGPPVNLALSAQAVHVPSGSGWMTAYFPITAADLVVDTYGTASGALASVDTLRIFHNPDPTFPGPGAGIPPVTASLGVDNISTRIPEPSTLLLMGIGLAGLWVRSRTET